jgi:hypothetical protein
MRQEAGPSRRKRQENLKKYPCPFTGAWVRAWRTGRLRGCRAGRLRVVRPDKPILMNSEMLISIL